MSRVFLSHSSRDNRQAIALKRWLEQAEPGLVGEIYLDMDPETGIQTGMRWTEALWQVNARCEAVICLLSGSWAPLKSAMPSTGRPRACTNRSSARGSKTFTEEDMTRAWQSCDCSGTALRQRSSRG